MIFDFLRKVEYDGQKIVAESPIGGILDVCQKLQLLDEEQYVKGRELIIRIVSILVKMAQRKN